MSIYKYKAADLKIKDVDMKRRTVSGYFTSFNVLDSDGDIGRKGMFARTLQEQGPKSAKPRIKHLLNHDPSKPLGVPLDLIEDDFGLFYLSEIGTHNLGEDFLKMADSGLITEHSYGYKIIREKRIQEGNELLEVKLWEGSSLTAWGANEFTPLIPTLKGKIKAEQLESVNTRIKSLEKFIRNSTVTDETAELLMLQIKQLQQLVIDLSSSTPAADNAPEPQKQVDYSSLIANIKSTTQIFKI